MEYDKVCMHVCMYVFMHYYVQAVPYDVVVVLRKAREHWFGFEHFFVDCSVVVAKAGFRSCARTSVSTLSLPSFTQAMNPFSFSLTVPYKF